MQKPRLTDTIPEPYQQVLDIIARGDLPDPVAELVDADEADLNWVHPETGLPLLHYAVGSDRLKIMKVHTNKCSTGKIKASI
jgi:hypothetical protein